MENSIIRPMVRSVYDIQKLRMQVGNRIAGNFRHKLEKNSGQKKEKDLEKESQKILSTLRKDYKRITDAIVSKYGAFKAPTDKNFSGQGVIETKVEFMLVHDYMNLITHEQERFKHLEQALKNIPIWEHYLKDVRGIGAAMAGVIVSELDPYKATYPSSFVKYAGLDVAKDGRGRGRFKEHLEKSEYLDKDGKQQTKLGITFNPFLKTKLTGVLGGSFLKAGGKYSEIYYEYKNRLENHPVHKEKTKGHRHNMANRYMIKRFLIDLHVKWRALEGLPVSEEYAVAKLGLVHKKAS